MGANPAEPEEAHRSRPGHPPSELIRPAVRPAGPGSPPAGLRSAGAARRDVPSELLDRVAALHPVDLNWVPPEVVAACSGALRRIRDRPGSALAVTSAVRGEGRTTIALGTALARRNSQGLKAVLLDLDQSGRDPSLAVRAGLSPTPGLAGVLRGEATLQECLAWPAEHLGVLPAGDARDAPPGMSGAALSSVLNDLRRAGYSVVADLPPLSVDGQAERLVDLFSTTLLVVRAGSTPMDVVQRAAATLADPPVVVLNRKTSAVPRWLRPLGG